MNMEYILKEQQAYFRSGATRSLSARLEALSKLEKMVRDNQERICAALWEDLHKPAQEALISEVAVTLEEIQVAKRYLSDWMRATRRKTPLALYPSRSRVHYEPLGVALIISPWNYPFQLAVAPLVGALAAGNCAVVKPSELTPRMSSLMAELAQKYFSKEYVRVVEGGIQETTALLSLKFDHVFFTGSTPVGRIVMQAAAKNLVPVTLELGGKSPAIVSEHADLDLAARRIVWGKFYNAGQTCVAPDYLYAHESIASHLMTKIKENIQIQFGERPEESSSFARIVNQKNCDRLLKLIDPEKIFCGGQGKIENRYVEPTVLKEVTWDDPVMQEEIFGPILPVLTYRKLPDLLDFLSAKPKPLAAYFFSRSGDQRKYFVENLSFGGGCLNDVVLHLSNPHLPFGGVGQSGMGRYHGKDSFLTFSHAKSVMQRFGLLDLSARYAPYSEGKLSLLRRLFKV